MRTDNLFYQLFHTSPGIFFELIGRSATEANGYEFRSVEIKQPDFRLDGVFVPSSKSSSQLAAVPEPSLGLGLVQLVVENTAQAAKQGKRKKLPKSLKSQYSDACPIHCGHKLTHYQFAQVKLHQKKRYAYKLFQQIQHLKTSSLHVNLGNLDVVEMVGSKDESYGNQICQLDLPGKQLVIRVPYCLESRYGKYVIFPIRLPKHGQDELATAWWNHQAIAYRFILKSLREWEIHITVSVEAKPIQTQPIRWGAIGVDLNVDSIGYALADADGNLTAPGQIKLNLLSQPTGQTEAQLVDAVTQLVTLAQTYNCPIVIEKLDFSEKKKRLREMPSRFNRMLSGFAYSKFYSLLKSRCFKLGIQVIEVNPVYSSLIGLIKFMSMYGMNSATAAALVLARRAMRLSERTPTRSAYQGTEPRKHVWSNWSVVSKRVKGSRRHSFFQPRLTASSSLRSVLSKQATAIPLLEIGMVGETPTGSHCTVKWRTCSDNNFLQVLING